jgi:prevent-host-death family protein
MSRVVNATEFKAKCLAYLDETDREGTSITITRRGRPVAILSGVPKAAWKSPRDTWAQKARIDGDIVNSSFAGLWDITPKV